MVNSDEISSESSSEWISFTVHFHRVVTGMPRTGKLVLAIVITYLDTIVQQFGAMKLPRSSWHINMTGFVRWIQPKMYAFGKIV